MDIIEKIKDKLDEGVVEEVKEIDTKEITRVKNSLDAIEEYLDDTREALKKGRVKGAQHSMKTLKNFVEDIIESLSKIKLK